MYSGLPPSYSTSRTVVIKAGEDVGFAKKHNDYRVGRKTKRTTTTTTTKKIYILKVNNSLV